MYSKRRKERKEIKKEKQNKKKKERRKERKKERLPKRMKIMGLPDDLTDLISVWLRDRSVSEWKNQSGLVKGNFR